MQKPRHGGFTLLEMLVVMALMALMMSLVGPNFIGQMEKSRTRFATDQFKSQITQLPRWARLLGQPLKLQKITGNWQVAKEELLSLPEGWHAEFTPALLVAPAQLCTASTARLLDDTGHVASSLLISAPGCEVSDEILQ